MAQKKLLNTLGAIGIAAIAALTGYAFNHSSSPSQQAVRASGTLQAKESMDAFYGQNDVDKLQETLTLVRQQMNETQKDVDSEKSVQDAIRNLSDRDLKSLETQVMNQESRMEDRQAALYLLTQSGHQQASEILATLASSEVPQFENLQDPHSVGSAQRTFEMSLRVTAIEGLDGKAGQNPDVAQELRQILQKQKEPTLRFLAETSLSGIEAGKPGHLKRIINEMLGATE